MMTYAVLIGLVGLLFIFFEFFLPGGIFAVLGACSLLSGVLLTGFFGLGWTYAALYLFVSLILTALVCFIALRKIKKSASTDSFFLSRDQQGFNASSIDPSLIGKMGIADSDLKPSGHILVDDSAYQAIADKGYICRGDPIEIIGTGPSYYIVKSNKEQNI
ncbi:MAG: hypothetical protein EB051_00435 [Chlamydiia bacterium]|nr:hypothetical protein [Chlamydiia bacterium]